MPEFERVASVSEVPPGGRKSLVFDERAVLLFRIGDDFYAVEDVCSHDGQPLTDGPLAGYSVECPRHACGSTCAPGKPLCMPAVEPIAVYEVKIQGDDVCLRPSD